LGYNQSFHSGNILEYKNNFMKQLIEAEVVHNEVIMMSVNYLAFLGTQLKTSTPEKDLNVMIAKLDKLGATNSETYKRVSAIINKNNIDAKNAKLMHEAYNKWKIMKEVFPDSILISYVDLIKLCYKYNLCIDQINYFAKEIPLDIIDYLADINNIIERKSEECDEFKLNYNLERVEKVNYSSRMERKYPNIGNDLTKTLFRCPIFKVNGSYRETETVLRRIGIEEENAYDIGVLTTPGPRITRRNLFIAAPSTDFLERDIKVEMIPIVKDPIVFQYTDIGIIVHAKWGEVKDDQIWNGK
jgi:hypothetical protein